jgi:hypothetical protein
MQKVPWNKGRLTGQKRPLKPKDVWAIRVRLQLEHRARDLALFNLAIDSKLRGCDLVGLEVDDVCAGGRVRDRATIIQKKTGRPVQFEITEQTRTSIQEASEGQRTEGKPSLPEPNRTYRRDNMHGSSMLGSRAPGWTAPPTARIRWSDEGGADLQKDGQPASRPAAPRAYEAREHGPVPRHRGRRGAHHLRAGRAVN